MHIHSKQRLVEVVVGQAVMPSPLVLEHFDEQYKNLTSLPTQLIESS